MAPLLNTVLKPAVAGALVGLGLTDFGHLPYAAFVGLLVFYLLLVAFGRGDGVQRGSPPV